MIWNVQFKLERPEEYRKEDETWFEEKHIKSEIKIWLEDLDYTVKEINVKKRSK